MACECPGNPRPVKWTGERIGKAECREYGLWCKWNPENACWNICLADDPDAVEDLNLLYDIGKWDKTLEKMVLSAEVKAEEEARRKRVLTKEE